MKSAFIAFLVCLVVAPLSAQSVDDWDRVALNGGEASLETPCPARTVVAQGEPMARSLICQTQDVQITLTLLPKSMTILPLEPGTSFDEMVEVLSAQPNTRYAIEADLEGNPAFRTEGTDGSTPIAVMMADLGEDRLLTLLVVPAQGAAEGVDLTATFERIADSIRLGPIEQEEEEEDI
ncbi:MAG: hypothetical protein AAGL10_02865 [Pseudomonadota bacterium]